MGTLNELMNEKNGLEDEVKLYEKEAEQLLAVWEGRATYDNDREWLENVAAAIGTVAGYEGIDIPDPKPLLDEIVSELNEPGTRLDIEV